MIRNFDETKRQLSELAAVINSFKSEAVQLKIIELVLKGGAHSGEASAPSDLEARSDAARPPTTGKKRRTRSPKTRASNTGSGTKGKKRGSGGGPAAILELLIGEGFFKKRQTIGQIVEHCGSSKARSVKPNEISGPLGRFVRNNKLKRQKNADGQYEYFA